MKAEYQSLLFKRNKSMKLKEICPYCPASYIKFIFEVNFLYNNH